ncbi:putative MscS family protein YkuT [archaeon HR01]|nr:putative MscS family protein YkuT [archaeon HR01]
MSARRIVIIFLTTIVLGALTFLMTRAGMLPPRLDHVIYAVLTVVAGVYLIRSIANTLRRAFQPVVGGQAVGASLLVQVVGYTVIAILVMSLVGIPPEAALAGGTVTGLVLGFGAQATIANILAGLIILASRPFKIGDRIAILSASIPFQIAFLPPYKFFSRDYYLPAYTGVVKEMGLMYTIMVTDDGLTIRYPNSLIIAGSAVANYSESYERTKKIRYEFPLELEPSKVLAVLSEKLRDIGVNVTEPVIEEQGDKNSYIVSVLATSEKPSDWPQVKTAILEKFIATHRELTAKT